MKRLLIIAHTPSPNTVSMRDALVLGANREAEGIEVLALSPFDAKPETVRNSSAYLLLTTENLGYMSGALKDFFDRVYYPVLEETQARSYALVIRAGHDGTGTRRAVESIAGAGLRWKAAQKPLICKGKWDGSWLQDCEELGAAMAAGLAMGIF